MKALVEFIAKSLVDHPDAVAVTEHNRKTAIVLELHVAPEDMGRVIGKDGRVANAIRSLLRACASKEGKRVSLEIV